jgi:hypothetical protein
MSKLRVPKVDLFTGTAGALARMSHRGERLSETRFLTFETSVCRRNAGEGARAPSKALNAVSVLSSNGALSRED